LLQNLKINLNGLNPISTPSPFGAYREGEIDRSPERAYLEKSDTPLFYHFYVRIAIHPLVKLSGQLFISDIRNLHSGTYHIQIQDELMCTIDTIIQLQSVCEIYLPNVFSPNADGNNDVSGTIQDIPFEIWEFSIFDRSGNMVFDSDSPFKGWNGEHYGKLVQSVVYAWT